MKQYDEYQKLMRYKYGYYSFNTLIILLALNYILGLFFNFQWGATKELEMLSILFIVAIVFTNISVYHNAYFRKNENKKDSSWLLLFVGLFGLYGTYQTFLFQPEEIIINGNINRGIIQLFSSLMFVSIPITYFVRNKIDERRDRKDGWIFSKVAIHELDKFVYLELYQIKTSFLFIIKRYAIGE